MSLSVSYGGDRRGFVARRRAKQDKHAAGGLGEGEVARTYRVREVGGGKGLDALEPGPVGWVLPRVNAAWLRAARGGDLGPGSNQSHVHPRSCSGGLRADQGRRCRSQLCWVPSLSPAPKKMLIRLALVGLLELTCLYNALVKVEKGGEGRGQKKKKKKIFFLERPPPSRFRFLRSPLLEDDRDPKSHHEQGGGTESWQ